MLANRRNTFIAVLLSALTLSGCGSQLGKPIPGTFRINLANEPPSLDWAISTDSTSFDVVSNIMVGLTQYRPDLSCAPACAAKWDITDGGKRYIFHLRPDVKWTDGKNVTAHDFVYAWRRMLDPKTAAPYAFFLYDVEGAEDYNTGKIKDPQKVGVRATDDYTLEVNLRKPASYFIYLTAICASYPQRQDVIEKFGERWTEPENMVTNGPFYLKDWQHEYKIELAANTKFFEGKPKLDTIKMFMIPEQATAFALYQNNQLDFIDNRSFPTPEVARYKDSPEYKNFPLLRNNYIGFNVHKAPFTDKRVRQAISKGIDRSIFAKILRRGESPSFTWIPDGLAGYSADSGPTFDPAAARQLLVDAGVDGKKFPKISVLYPTREDTRLVMEAIQDQLKRNLGIEVQLENKEWKVFLQNLRQDPPPMFRNSWGADYPDPETFANIFASYNTNNVTTWKSKSYDEVVQKAAGEQDSVKRAAMYQSLDKTLCSDECVIAPTFLSTQNVMIKPWVKGIALNKIDIQFFKEVAIDESAGGRN